MKCYRLAIFLFVAALHAAPVENTSFPSILQDGFLHTYMNQLNIRTGYEGDFLFDAKMEQYLQGKGEVDTYEMWTNAGTLTLNLLNRMDVYAVLGASHTQTSWRFENTVLDTIHRIKLDTNNSFLWGVGTRIILCEWWNTSLGTGGRYSFSQQKPNQLTTNGIEVDSGGAQIHFQSWQVHLDISYKIQWMIPYLGTKYSHVRTSLNDFPTPISNAWTGSNSFKNRDFIGFYIGCTLSTGKYVMLNIEGRVVDEDAITLSGEIRF